VGDSVGTKRRLLLRGYRIVDRDFAGDRIDSSELPLATVVAVRLSGSALSVVRVWLSRRFEATSSAEG
jgi:hypothetical protein